MNRLDLLPNHDMYENQVALTLKGPIDDPVAFTSFRAGIAKYRAKGVHASQTSHSLQPEEMLRAAHNRLREKIETSVQRFMGLDATLSLQSLIRKRWFADPGITAQEYQGFWGSLRVPGTWDSFFGCHGQGDLVFRRGCWEEWPCDLAEFERIDPCLPSVFSPFCATLFHEAVGHGMEAEFLEGSPFKFHMGERISCPELTIMDRPDLPGYCSSMAYDDAGMAATQTTLVYRGVVVGDLAKGQGVHRRGSFRDLPQIRASNFLLKPGDAHPQSWLETLPQCYYVTSIQRGNWRPGSTRINVLTGPVVYLERGEPKAQKPWVVLQFSILDLLQRIEAVGTDLVMDPVLHWCMKKNQAVPFAMGSPSILLKGQGQ